MLCPSRTPQRGCTGAPMRGWGGHIWGRYAVPGVNSSLLSPSLSHLCPQLHSNACLLPYHSGLGYWGIHHGSPGPRGPSWLLELTISNSLHSKQALAPVAQPAPPPFPGGKGENGTCPGGAASPPAWAPASFHCDALLLRLRCPHLCLHVRGHGHFLPPGPGITLVWRY